jgi:hypothetical protein
MGGIRVFLLFVVLFGSIETAQAQWSTPGSISYNGGNVGVNTSCPAARVHIEGDVLLGSYKAYISRYTTDNQYCGHTQWDHLQLGNNGPNYRGKHSLWRRTRIQQGDQNGPTHSQRDFSFGYYRGLDFGNRSLLKAN